MSNKILKNTHKSAFVIGLLGLSLIFSYIEAILPINVGYLGVRVGLSNIVTLISLKVLNIKHTLIINILRLIIIGVLFGNIVRFMLSVSGFFASFIVMVVMLNILNYSIETSSIFGGAFHNIGQIIALSIITNSTSVLKLLPIYIVIGIVTGFFIGVISSIIYKRIGKFYSA